MTGMSASAASWSTCDSVVPSIEAMISASAPLVIMFSICETWVGMSSSAYWRSTVKPCSSSCCLDGVAVLDPALRALGGHRDADEAAVSAAVAAVTAAAARARGKREHGTGRERGEKHLLRVLHGVSFHCVSVMDVVVLVTVGVGRVHASRLPSRGARRGGMRKSSVTERWFIVGQRPSGGRRAPALGSSRSGVGVVVFRRRRRRFGAAAAGVVRLAVHVLVAVEERVDRVLRDRDERAGLAGEVHGARDVLDHDGGLDRVLRVRADRERPVVAHQHRAAAVAGQRLDDAAADRVVADDRERADRDRAAELVGHRR